MEPGTLRTVVLAAGGSERMGWNKLTVPLAGSPLACRTAVALAGFAPLVVAQPAVAALLAGMAGVTVLATGPTASTAASLALANAAIPAEAGLLVVPCDLPFLDAPRIRDFLARVPPDADLAFPVVDDVPGHPVVWSPAARRRLAALGPGETPVALRRDPSLHVVALAETDPAYVTDCDTPEAWEDARRRLAAENP